MFLSGNANSPADIPAPGDVPLSSRPDTLALPGHVGSKTALPLSGHFFFEYALTRIFQLGYIRRVMDTVFEVIAEPNRRAILSLLGASEQSVGEIERRLHMPQPAVSKHLRVLREAGFVESTVDAQRRLYRLRPEPLQEVDMWLAQFRRFWSAHVDALERHLDRMEPSTPKKTKIPNKRRNASRKHGKGETK
jgi:DNA-binding transcriptional ArsR family regulator